MATIISASVDLSKIDKSKIIEGKNNAKYYNLDIIINDDFDKYNNNVSITDKQTKEERTEKAKKKYLGNGRVVWKSDGKSASDNNASDGAGRSDSPAGEDEDSQLPF